MASLRATRSAARLLALTGLPPRRLLSQVSRMPGCTAQSATFTSCMAAQQCACQQPLGAKPHFALDVPPSGPPRLLRTPPRFQTMAPATRLGSAAGSPPVGPPCAAAPAGSPPCEPGLPPCEPGPPWRTCTRGHLCTCTQRPNRSHALRKPNRSLGLQAQA